MDRERNRRIYNLWSNIQDIVGPAREWPYLIRRLFWTPDLRHFQRILIVTFAFVNGLNPVLCLEWVDVMHLARDRAARNHFHALFRLV